MKFFRLGRRTLFFSSQSIETQELDRSWLTTRKLISFDVSSEKCCFPYASTAATLHQHAEKLSGKAEKDKDYDVFLISSKAELTAEDCLRLKRKYWFIEGSAHQMLDCSRLQEDKSRVKNRNSAYSLGLFRRAAISLGIHWIRHQKNPRKATMNGFFDQMSLKNSAIPFRIALSKKASWLP